MNNGQPTYKEWTNYETWITYRWLKDAPLTLEWRTYASQLARQNPGPVEVKQAIEQMADELRDAVWAECSCDAKRSADQRFCSAFENTDWREVARVILGTAIPAASAFDWLFRFGDIMETASVREKIPSEERLDAVARHSRGDWGETENWSDNESALKCGKPLYSEYLSKTGDFFLIVTTDDRSVTTLLLPEEYESSDDQRED